jgi:hypothetical protein
MNEEIPAFLPSRGFRKRCCAKGGVRCCWLLRNTRRCDGDHWRMGTVTVFLHNSYRNHNRASQCHAAPGIDNRHGGAGRIFDRRNGCCLGAAHCPSSKRKFRRVSFRWRLQFRGCLRSATRSAAYGPEYLPGAQAQGLTGIVGHPRGLGSGRKSVRQNDGTAPGRPQKSVTDCDAASEQDET